MPTERPRVQVTLDENTNGLLSTIAKKQDRSMSAIAAELIRDALELHEDIILSKISDKRYEESLKEGVFVSHEDAWK